MTDLDEKAVEEVRRLLKRRGPPLTDSVINALCDLALAALSSSSAPIAAVKGVFAEGAMRQLTRVNVAQYLLANTIERGNGALKAHHHEALTVAYVAAHRNCDPDDVRRLHSADYDAIHDATAKELTDRLDEAIGFDLHHVDDEIEERFFRAFHTTATSALDMSSSGAKPNTSEEHVSALASIPAPTGEG